MAKIRIIGEPSWPDLERLKWVREATVGLEVLALDQEHPEGYMVLVAAVLETLHDVNPFAAKLLAEWARDHPDQVFLVPRQDCRLVHREAVEG